MIYFFSCVSARGLMARALSHSQ